MGHPHPGRPQPGTTLKVPFLEGGKEKGDFPDGSVGKASTCNAGDTGDMGLISGLGRSRGVGNGNPLQDSCLENPMDRGAWQAAVHRASKSQTWLSD